MSTALHTTQRQLDAK